MLKRYRYFKLVTKIVLSIAVAMAIMSHRAFAAGSINANEERVLAVADGTFEYDGKTYKAYSSYVSMLYSYLSRANIDLSPEQADRAINYIYSNVKEGIRSGYIYEVKNRDKKTEVQKEELGPSATRDKPENTGEQNTEPTENTSGGNNSGNNQGNTSGGNNSGNNQGNTSGGNNQGSNSGNSANAGNTTEKTTEKTTDKITSENTGTGGSSQSNTSEVVTENTEEPTTEPASDINIEELFSGIENEITDEKSLNERVDPENAEASAVIDDNSIVIDMGDGDQIELDPEKRIIPEAWTLTLKIVAIVVCSITALMCLILIATKCMRFRNGDKSKPQHGHRRRHKIRKVCRVVLLVTTGVSIAGLFMLIALFAAFFTEGRIEKNIQDSGYFRYAYIQYLTDHGKALEGAEFLSDEEAAIVSGTLSTAETESDEVIMTYDQFIVKEKQATQELLKGNRDVEYQKSNVAPYILRLKEDLQPAMLLSFILFMVSIILGCVFSIFMDLRRDRGIRMIAVSDLVGTAFTGAVTVCLLIWSPAKRLFIEPDYLYLFFKNYMDYIARTLAVISIFGLVLGMALIGVYVSRHKERRKK